LDSVYCPKQAVLNLAVESSLASYTLPALRAIVGAFDRDAIAAPPPPKEKKIRATPRKRQFNEGNETQHEEVNLTQEQMRQKQKAGADSLSKELLKVLKIHAKKEPVNLMDFAMEQQSLDQCIQNLFYTGFLVRDGCVSVTVDSKFFT